MSNSSNSLSSAVNKDAHSTPHECVPEPVSKGVDQIADGPQAVDSLPTSVPHAATPVIVAADNHSDPPGENLAPYAAPCTAQDDASAEPTDMVALLENCLQGPLSKVTDGLGRLENLFEQKINRELHLNQIIDQLHADLQDQKRGLVRQILQPLAIDLITLYDDLGDRSDKYRGKAAQDAAASVVAKEADGTREEIEDILYRYGVQKYTVAEPQFNATRQRAIRLEATTDAALDGTTFLRRRCGFEYDGQVLRSEQVVVYRFEPATTVAERTELPSSSDPVPNVT